jgi:hypothetical protein
MEATVTRAAVGLFENSDLVGEIVHDLEASGFPRNGIRVLNEPQEMAGSGLMSTPHTDFEVELVRECRTIGAGEADAQAYEQGIRRGGVIVFATGSNRAG